MKSEADRNFGHSTFQKLLTYAHGNREDFNLLLARFAIERFLYRLSISEYAGRFILKGASLFLIWMGKSFRVTRDVDLLGSGPANPEQLVGIFRDIIELESPGNDGLTFDYNSIRAFPIREDQLYEGIRVTIIGLLHTARIPLQIDVGFGDAVIPAPEDIKYPSLLGHPAARLRAYSPYTAAAEKIDTMINLGMINSRMKDFYDIWLMSGIFEFNGTILQDSMKNTFIRRGTRLPEGLPLVFSQEFSTNHQKTQQWKAFIRKSRPENAPENFAEVMDVVSQFVLPVYKAILEDTRFHKEWTEGGPWRLKERQNS
jgi:Nucleotidyl transferase AbiEii toxin, Type IV TA system